MSSPAPVPNTPATTTGSSATTTPATSTTHTKKPAAIKALTGFTKLSPNDLLNQGRGVVKGMTGNTAFPNPSVDLNAFSTLLDTLSNDIVSALDRGKNAKAVLKKDRKLVIQDMTLLAVYAQNNCNDDPQVFATSGFTAKASKKTTNQPVAVPSFRSIDFGANSGTLLIAVKGVTGARAYFVRYAVMNGVQPGPWTTLTIPNIRTAYTLTNLTPATTYGFQVQVLGPIGYSDWSTTETIICI
jgi:hypothetical protein